jgi:adenylate cyclase
VNPAKTISKGQGTCDGSPLDFGMTTALDHIFTLRVLAKTLGSSVDGGSAMSISDKKLVLIVDDTPTNVAVVAGLLKDSFRTKVANNGEKAITLAAGPDRPDLILLDVTMSGMDGYQVCRRLKGHPSTRDIPVIFLTGETDEPAEEKGFNVGAVDYIHKPFSGPLVLARIRSQFALQEALIAATEARKQADQLLNVLLPKSAADELRSVGTVIPRRYENVVVLFCDVTNLTDICNKHDAQEVVSRLDSLFVIFERITAKHGLEKIKTTVDGFMAAANLLRKIDDPISAAVRCGLEMSSTLIDAHLGLDVRAAVHAGPVVAGIVGQERYQFDIWGDTVNVAAHLVGMSAPGTVVASEAVVEQTLFAFEGTLLGKLNIKGKGAISLIALTNERPAQVPYASASEALHASGVERMET